MIFVEAMAAIKTHKTTIKRRTWGEQSYLKIYSSELANDYFECNGMGEYKTDSIINKNDGENAEVWVPIAEDICADDWEIYVEPINESKQTKEKEE